jgi:hypothetical protein
MIRRPELILLGALGIALPLYILAIDPYIGAGYDNAQYVVLAKALARGVGFSQIQIPGDLPEPKYPPGWPLLLAPVWLLAPDFPANAAWFKLVSVVFGLAFVAVTYAWMHWRGEGVSACLFIALLTLVHPRILGYATSAFSEMAYAFFSVVALWLIEAYEQTAQPRWRDAFFPALVAVGAMLLRTFGLALIAAGMVYLLFRRRWRHAAYFGALTAIGSAPWFARGILIADVSGSYLQHFFLKVMERPALGTIGWEDLVVRGVLNVRAYLLAGLPGALMPSQVPLTFVNLVEGQRVGAPFPGSDVLLAIIVGGGLVGQAVWRRAPVDWYVLCYLGLCLAWPWEPTRFVVPLIPMLYAYAFFEIGLIIRAFRMPWRAWLRTGGIALLVVFIVLNLVTQARYTWMERQAPISAERAARARLFEWIIRATPPESVLATLPDGEVYLYTGRQAIRELGSAEKLLHYTVSYVVLIPYGGMMTGGDLSQEDFAPLYAAYHNAFVRVYVDEAANLEVFQVNQEALAR